MKKRIINSLKKIFVSSLYAISFFVATGIPQTALAVMCNEVVPGTAVKYSDALVGFVYDGTKTYAISKSAITGSLNLPDVFFAFSSGIDQGYQYSGVDTASLKFMVINGKYGAARPVLIDSKAKLDFITKQFTQYLGAAGSARSTYINAWKEYGANRTFTDFWGGALPYTNWPNGVAPDTSTITAPQAVTMGLDGIWLNGESAQRLSQVVEFDGKLDCALDLTSLSNITPPVPPVPPPTDPNAIQGVICAQDLNKDDVIGSNELQNCIKTPQGDFCPVGSLDCTATYQPALCPDGTTLNTARDMCQTDPSVQCPTGYTWDKSIDKCTSSVTCTDNGSYNTVTDRCEKLVQNDCTIGYTYDANVNSPTYDRCVKSATCTSGGAFIADRDRCEKAWMPICDTVNGYSFNAQSGMCQRAPICSSGSYNTSYNLCMKPFNPVCPGGYSFNSTTNRCEMVPICPYGTNFNSATNRCETLATTTTGYSQPNTGKTEIIKYKTRGDMSTGITQYSSSPPNIDSLSFDFILQNGQVVLKQECAWGGAGNCGCDRPHWNGWCRAGTDLTLSRNGNTLTVVATIFDWNYDYNSPYCDPGYNLSYDYELGYSCMGCPTQGYDWESGTSYTYYACSGTVRYTAYKSYTTGAAASADLSEFVSCPPGYTLTGPPSSSTCTAIVSQWGVQTGITDCTQAGLYSCSAPVNVCNAGYTLSGNVCFQNPTCPSGSFDTGAHVCYAAVDKQCADGFWLDAGTGLCIKNPVCPNGGLNPTIDMCEATVAKDCGTYSLDATTNVCFSAPVCADGTYESTLNVCQSSLSRNCGTYSWSQADFKCIQSVVCPQDSAYSLNNTIKFDGVLDSCVSDTMHNCVTGTAYNGLPVLMCEAIPVCGNGAVRYDTTAHACYIGNNTCPLGPQYTCMDYSGKMQCSANSCFDQSNPSGGEVTTTMDESMYQDDARNPDGSCNGQIMIFAGKPSRCRPPGLKVGYLNNCCKSDQVMSEDVGNSIQTGVTAIKTMYEIGQVAYYSYMVSTGAYTATAVGGVTTVATTAGATVTTLSGAVGSGVAAAGTAGAAGATTAGTMMASMQAYATALLNPATIAIAIVVMVVMKVLMGSGCDQTDIQTGGQVESKQCHYIGDYCEKKWPLFGCVQQAKGYCCFNSMMARIIHEQGRPQLTTFGPDGAWGTPSAPNCRGFLPGEFESLDFAKIDMGEYFEVLQKDMATNIQKAQDAINNTIQQRTQQIQTGK